MQRGRERLGARVGEAQLARERGLDQLESDRPLRASQAKQRAQAQHAAQRLAQEPASPTIFAGLDRVDQAGCGAAIEHGAQGREQLGAKARVVVPREPVDQGGHAAKAADLDQRGRGLLLDPHLGVRERGDDHGLGPARGQAGHAEQGLAQDSGIAGVREPPDRALEPARTLARGHDRLQGGALNLGIALAPERLDLAQRGPARLVPADRLEQGHADRRARVLAQPVDREGQDQLAPGVGRVVDPAPHAAGVGDQSAAVAVDQLLERGHADPLDREVARERLGHVVAEDRPKAAGDLGQRRDAARLAQDPQRDEGIDRVHGPGRPGRVAEDRGRSIVAGGSSARLEQAGLVRPEPLAQLAQQRRSVAAQRPQSLVGGAAKPSRAARIFDLRTQPGDRCLAALDPKHRDHGLGDPLEPREQGRFVVEFGRASGGLDQRDRDSEVPGRPEALGDQQVRARVDARGQDRGAPDPAAIVGGQLGERGDQRGAGDVGDADQQLAGPALVRVEGREQVGDRGRPNEDAASVGLEQEHAHACAEAERVGAGQRERGLEVLGARERSEGRDRGLASGPASAWIEANLDQPHAGSCVASQGHAGAGDLVVVIVEPRANDSLALGLEPRRDPDRARRDQARERGSAHARRFVASQAQQAGLGELGRDRELVDGRSNQPERADPKPRITSAGHGLQQRGGITDLERRPARQRAQEQGLVDARERVELGRASRELDSQPLDLQPRRERVEPLGDPRTVVGERERELGQREPDLGREGLDAPRQRARDRRHALGRVAAGQRQRDRVQPLERFGRAEAGESSEGLRGVVEGGDREHPRDSNRPRRSGCPSPEPRCR